MGSIGESVMGALNSVKQKMGFGSTPVETTVEKAVAPLPSGTDLGTAAEPAGYTSAGGRRHRKTRKGGRKHRKTHKKGGRKH